MVTSLLPLLLHPTLAPNNVGQCIMECVWLVADEAASPGSSQAAHLWCIALSFIIIYIYI